MQRLNVLLIKVQFSGHRERKSGHGQK